MAKRKSTKRYPVQRSYQLDQPLPAAGTTALVDVPMHLSQVNHRLYRQSRYYEVSVTVDTDMADTTTLDVYALSDTWMNQKALQLAKSAWDESNAEELKMLNGKKARWNDFRVRSGLTAPFPTPNAALHDQTTLNVAAYTAGEFEDSQVVDQAGTIRHFTWSQSPAPTEYDLYEEYDDSGNTTVDPTTPATGPYSGLLPNLEAGAAAALQDDGNNPPYNATSLGNAVWTKVGTLTIRAGRAKTTTGYFTAPCGFVVLSGAFIASSSLNDISIEIKQGNYKGVKAPSMLE